MSSTEDLANILHATAIYLLRTARADDPETGLSPARLSALSVIIHAGPLSLSELAGLEQISRPAMSQLIAGLEYAKLVQRRPDPGDGRRALLDATAQGRRLLHAARRNRVKRIRAMLERMAPEDRKALEKGLAALAAAFPEPNRPGVARLR